MFCQSTLFANRVINVCNFLLGLNSERHEIVLKGYVCKRSVVRSVFILGQTSRGANVQLPLHYWCYNHAVWEVVQLDISTLNTRLLRRSHLSGSYFPERGKVEWGLGGQAWCDSPLHWEVARGKHAEAVCCQRLSRRHNYKVARVFYDTDNAIAERPFYIAANGVLGKVLNIASEDIILQLNFNKYLPNTHLRA